MGFSSAIRRLKLESSTTIAFNILAIVFLSYIVLFTMALAKRSLISLLMVVLIIYAILKLEFFGGAYV